MAFGHFESAAGDVECRQAKACAVGADRCDEIVLFSVKQRIVCQRAGCNDANNLAVDRSLAGCGITNLFADGDRHAQPDQLGQVAVNGVIGHAAHRNGFPGGSAAGGQGDVQQVGSLFGIVVE